MFLIDLRLEKKMKWLTEKSEIIDKEFPDEI